MDATMEVVDDALEATMDTMDIAMDAISNGTVALVGEVSTTAAAFASEFSTWTAKPIVNDVSIIFLVLGASTLAMIPWLPRIIKAWKSSTPLARDGELPAEAAPAPALVPVPDFFKALLTSLGTCRWEPLAEHISPPARSQEMV